MVHSCNVVIPPNPPPPARQVTVEGYLEECPISHGFGSTVELSAKGEQWLHDLTGRRSGKEEEPVLQLLPNQELQGAERESVRAPGTVAVSASKWVSGSVVTFCVTS